MGGLIKVCLIKVAFNYGWLDKSLFDKSRLGKARCLIKNITSLNNDTKVKKSKLHTEYQQVSNHVLTLKALS